MGNNQLLGASHMKFGAQYWYVSTTRARNGVIIFIRRLSKTQRQAGV